MKKLVNIILALAAITFHSSCINEEIVQDKPASGIRVYSDWAETRTSHQSSNGVTSVSWVEGDKIGLFAENQYNLCYIAENSGSFSDFTASDVSLDAADGDKVFAYYPYEQWTDQDGKSFRLPRTQGQWSSLGMSRYDALYAEEAVSNDELNLKFKHVFSFLKITVPTERLVRDSESGYYVLRLVSNEMLSNIEGNFNVETKEFDANCTTDVLYIIDKDIAGKSNVTCTVAILPQTGAANISIYACADNFSVENLLHTIDVPQSGLEAGKVYTVRIIDEQQAAGYSAWLGDWIITGANGIQQYVTFSKGKANETFIMSGYEGDGAAGLDVTVNWLEEDGIWVIYNQMLGTFNFGSYGNGDVWFVGEGETANIYLSEIPICLGRTLEDGSFAAYGYEEEYELEDGTPMSYKVVSMEYLAYLTDYGQLSYITSTYTTGYPTFPMTFTKIDAKSGDTDFVVQKHSFGKREKKFSVLHSCYPAGEKHLL